MRQLAALGLVLALAGVTGSSSAVAAQPSSRLSRTHAAQSSLRHSKPRRAVVAVIRVERSPAKDSVTLVASASTLADGRIIRFRWTLSEPYPRTLITTTPVLVLPHAFPAPTRVTLAVTDAPGHTATTHALIPAAPRARSSAKRAVRRHRQPTRAPRSPRPLVAQVAAAGGNAVAIQDFAFAPAALTIHVGDTITWTNHDQAPHTATASDHSFDTGILNKGQSGSHTFASAGTFPYICAVHPNMKATVTVLAAAAQPTTPKHTSGGASTTPSSSPSSSPAAASSAPPGSTLPVTGEPLLVPGALALLLLGIGVSLRRTMASR